jgi:endogenous inhibitor of DNA gyrase (YacG/DUF329 family)
MTFEQKTHLAEMRHAGFSFGEISTALGVSANTIKSFCWRNELASLPLPVAAPIIPPAVPNPVASGKVCAHCGAQLDMKPKQKLRRFCGKPCREAYWNSHRSEHVTSFTRHAVCAGCGKPFTYYAGSHRKYCNHACYVASRFHTANEVSL